MPGGSTGPELKRCDPERPSCSPLRWAHGWGRAPCSSKGLGLDLEASGAGRAPGSCLPFMHGTAGAVLSGRGSPRRRCKSAQQRYCRLRPSGGPSGAPARPGQSPSQSPRRGAGGRTLALRGGGLGRVTSPSHGGRAGHGEWRVGGMDREPRQLPPRRPQQPHVHSPLRPRAARVRQGGRRPHTATLRKHLHAKAGPQDPNLLLQGRRQPHSLPIRSLCRPPANSWTPSGPSAIALWGLQLS